MLQSDNSDIMERERLCLGSTKKRIAIIGGGAAGIIACSVALQEAYKLAEDLDITLFEASSQLGGLWNYQPSSPVDSLYSERSTAANTFLTQNTHNQVFQSAIYEGLVANLPKQLMQLSSFPFPTSTTMNENDDQQINPNPNPYPNNIVASPTLFPKHDEILKYLQSIAKKSGLSSGAVDLKFNRLVTLVEKVDDNQMWRVGSVDTRIVENENSDSYRGNVHHEEFDFVFIANGHFSQPFVPAIHGLDSFPFPVKHSQEYRLPNTIDTVGKRILVVGGSWSGRDLVREMSRYAQKVYWSCRGESENSYKINLDFDVEKKVEIVAEVSSFHSDGSALLKDGKRIQVAMVWFATGFHYTLPFLTPSEQSKFIVADGKGQQQINVPSLSHLMFSKEDPSLVFLGLLRDVSPFPIIEAQGRIAILLALNLNKKQMKELLREESRFTQIGGLDEYDYLESLAILNGDDDVVVPGWIRDLRKRVGELRMESLKY